MCQAKFFTSRLANDTAATEQNHAEEKCSVTGYLPCAK